MPSSDSETTVRRVLAPYKETLAAIPPAAWARYLAIPDRAPLIHPTARANVVNRYMIAEADDRLRRHPGVVSIDCYTTTVYNLADTVCIRFKFMGDDGLSRNFQTERASRYNEQSEIEGIPSHLLRVDIGYQLDALETSIVAVLATHRAGRRKNAWVIDLAEAAETFLFPTQLPMDIDQDVPAVRPREIAADAVTRKATGRG